MDTGCPRLASEAGMRAGGGGKDHALGARGRAGADAATGELPADGLAVAARDGRTRLRDAEIVDGASTLPDEAITECADRVQFAGAGIQHEASDADPRRSGAARSDSRLRDFCSSRLH